MKKSFRHSMTWLHTWTGLIFCWVLYFMFITGTLGYFDNEIDQWMKPELKPAPSFDLSNRVILAQQRLTSLAPQASQWVITPDNHRQNPYLRITWRDTAPDGRRGRRHSELLDASGQPMEARNTAGGQTLYRMHYLLHYMPRDIGFKIIAVITLVMFVSLITSIVAHKKIFKEFFTFRPGRGNSAWLDGHKLLSVASLPFQLMITYSGLLFAMNTMMPGIGAGSYGFDSELLSQKKDELRVNITSEPSGNPAQLADLVSIAEKAAQQWGEDEIRHIEVQHPGDSNAIVIVRRHETEPGFDDTRLVFNGITGQQTREHHNTEPLPLAVRNTFIDLHEGLFASPALRWMYFLSGLLGAGMIATGAIYWEKKRQRKNTAPKPGHRAVRLLNIATIAGLPIAIAGYFLANRLLPLELPGRAQWEVDILFLVWGAVLLYALLRPAQRIWRELFGCAAIGYLAIPVISGLTTDFSLWSSTFRDNPAHYGVDFTALVLSLLFLWLTLRLRHKTTTEKASDGLSLKEGTLKGGQS